MENEPNYKWFKDKFTDLGLSQAGFAKMLEMDPSNLSLLLHGKRRMRVAQASEIARLLGVPISDVIRNAGGLNAKLGRNARIRTLPLVGWADVKGVVTLDWTARESFVDFDADLPPTTAAIQWRTAGTAGELWDGWTLAILPPRGPDEKAMLDHYCVVAIRGGETLLRRVRRGYKPGRYTLAGAAGQTVQDADIMWFSPVLLIRPI